MSPFLIGAALGGAAMFFFDPDRGRRRRALVRDQAVGATHAARDFVDAGARDLKNRGTAAAARVKSLFNRRAATDHVLAERVRSVMGHHVAHPGAIDVYASGGNVTLNGSILSHEHTDLVEAVRGIRGVTAIIDHLSVYETAEGISELQGGREPRARDMMRPRTWTAGAQLAAGAAVGLFLLRKSSKLRGLLYAAAAGAALLRLTPQQQLEHLEQTAATEPDTQREPSATRTAEEVS